MALSNRLQTLFSMVQSNSIVADIGCDHGLLSIALAEAKVARKVYACDLRVEPLNRAKQAIAQAGYEQQVFPILCDGLQKVPSDCDVIVIAGMGADTILHILEHDFQRLSSFRQIIVQSNTRVNAIREWISNHRFTILEEQLVEEDHFYQMISFNTEQGRELSEDEIMFGTNQSHPLFPSFCRHQIQKIETILSQMPKEETSYQTFVNKKQELERKL